MAASGFSYVWPRSPSTRVWWLDAETEQDPLGERLGEPFDPTGHGHRVPGPDAGDAGGARPGAGSPTAASARWSMTSRPATSGSQIAP